MLRFILFLLLIWAFSAQCVVAEDNPEQLTALIDPSEHERILLIAFSDPNIHRIQNGAIPVVYRHRGPYASSTWSRRVSSHIEEQYGLIGLTEWPITEIGMHCAVFRVPNELSVSETVEMLSLDEQVELVQRLHLFKTEGHAYNDPYYRLQSNIHDMEIDQVHQSATGKNVTIAVIDTGVDQGHPDLVGQIEQSKNFVDPLSVTSNGELHGTAVSGVIAAQKDNRAGIIGVAPDSKIIALRACWPVEPDSFEALCNSFTLALAVNTAIQLGVDILNMSLAGPEDRLLERLLAKAKEEGIIVVAADPGSKHSEHRFPASLSSVIPVQSLEMENDNHAIPAPGYHILTTLPNGTYDFVSGSSLAAAQVSGLIALMRELNPDLSADQIKNILYRSLEQLDKSEEKKMVSGVNAVRLINKVCAEINC